MFVFLDVWRHGISTVPLGKKCVGKPSCHVNGLKFRHTCRHVVLNIYVQYVCNIYIYYIGILPDAGEIYELAVENQIIHAKADLDLENRHGFSDMFLRL